MTLDALGPLLSPAYDLHAADVRSKRVLVRVDFNVPISATGKVLDDSRITETLPTLQLLLGRGARVILASHLGRPDPDKQNHAAMVSEFSLQPVAQRLEQLLGAAFKGLAADCIGPAAEAAVAQLEDGQACLLENLRFHAAEVANDKDFAQQLAHLCDVYVNDAFGVMHRAQASVTGIPMYVQQCFPGLLVRKELKMYAKMLVEPRRPFGVVVGGAKVKDKIGVLWSLIEKADVVVVGGRMAFTFLAAEGVSVGRTQIEEAWLPAAHQMLVRAKEKGMLLLLPNDVLVSGSLDEPQQEHVVVLSTECGCNEDAPCVPAGCYGIDIGPASMASFTEALSRCSTIFWNGPMGRYEVPAFAKGTAAIAAAVAAATRSGATTCVGGGDSVAAINQLGLGSSFSHISTGGGAGLELIEGKALPGITALLR